MAERKPTTKRAPKPRREEFPGLSAFKHAHQRYILENFAPECYATGRLTVETDDDGAPRYRSESTISAAAKRYEAGITWGNLMRRLAKGEDAYAVPPIMAYHTEGMTRTESASWCWGPTSFQATVARLGAREGLSTGFAELCARARKMLDSEAPRPMPAPRNAWRIEGGRVVFAEVAA